MNIRYGDDEVPTPQCWQDIGHHFGLLAAQVEALKETAARIETKYDADHREIKTEVRNVSERVGNLEADRKAMTWIGGALAFILPGVALIFSEPIKAFGKSLFR
jgi:outer membrane murein-binding lipoprotein Lpp